MVSEVIFRHNQTPHAPHSIDLEIAQVLRRYARSAAIPAERAAEALADLVDFPLTRCPHFVLLPRILQMGHRLTAYDAAYLAWPKRWMLRSSRETAPSLDPAAERGSRSSEGNANSAAHGLPGHGTVITTFPRVCPSFVYQMAAGTSFRRKR
jgi:hypothetical protein